MEKVGKEAVSEEIEGKKLNPMTQKLLETLKQIRQEKETTEKDIKKISFLSDEINPNEVDKSRVKMSAAERALERMRNPTRKTIDENKTKTTGFTKSVDDMGIGR